ncbi:ILEI/PANDER domain-containing protein [Plasmodiophora brassicae]|uniref:ILEI/PANDER domain-containing protein n=1 Tax=Plasmodiophora brassicae TaxID=37360 RepID=A0A0G4IY22_PLABS|nr:hypothetical protein PBRA_007944 [Plasmodiophora brassicae]SPQ96478.1 unnamed protein product [Plasmodiophora brassicae]
MSDTAVYQAAAVWNVDPVAARVPVGVGQAHPKPKHGAYKIWHRNVEPLLREAYDSIYGLALYGSLVFATVRTPMGCIVIKQEVRDRFEGPAQLSITIPSTTAGQGGIPVQVASAGKDDGDFASVLVDGEQVARNERGINIVVFDCGTGNVRSSHSFDTHGSPSESGCLAKFVKESATLNGCLLLGSIRDDGAKFLTEEGHCALADLGVSLPEADNSERLAEIVHLLPADRCAMLLTVCAKANAYRCARLLLESGWPVSVKANHTKNTPLHDAAYQCNTEVAEVLIAFGACLKTTNRWGESPGDIAATRHSFSSLQEMLLAKSSTVQKVLRFLELDA